MKIVGYADRFSVHQGEGINFMVSSEAPRYRARVVRLIHGDVNPAGPGFKAESVASSIEGEHAGYRQTLRPGSYVDIPQPLPLDPAAGFGVHLWLQATTPDKPHQVLMTCAQFTISLDAGRPTLAMDGQVLAQVDSRVRAHCWYRLVAGFDADTGRVHLELDALAATDAALSDAASGDAPAHYTAAGHDGVRLAADRVLNADGMTATHFYNGKLDMPCVFDRPVDSTVTEALTAGVAPTKLPGLVAAWDFSRDIGSRRVTDISRNALHGRTMQMPARAMTGHNWDGSETAWRHAPHQYGAIHFHEDDLDDAGWDVSLAWAVPTDLPSGIYAIHLESDDGEDYVPFYVRPRRGTAGARILFLAPVFSYLAYANEQMLGSPASRDVFRRMNDGVLGHLSADYPAQPQDKYIVDNGLRSIYDTHVDGSGVCYSSRLRPIVNMRPKYHMPALDLGEGSPHQFNADLHLVDWLHECGYDYDVATDEDLHHEGEALLKRYDVVLTGTHHEYWSGAMLDALEHYLDAGGRLMYLAGNGFYWVTELDSELGHTVEVRRAGPATRTWDAAPGEACLSTTGTLGGLWRHAGRAPQRLVGVGFTAQGTGPGRPYVQAAGAREGRGAFALDGISVDELIGDFPSLVNGYGGAGFELDRVDHALGSPYATITLATASGFSNAYQHVSEEVLVSDSCQGGAVNPLVRADMVLLPYPNGGAVFSPSSIAWCGSLSYNGYDNTVSRVTRNVLDRFLDAEPI